MKKGLILPSLLLAAVALSACSVPGIKNNDQANANGASQGAQNAQGGPGAGNAGGRRMPDFGQPKENADFRGLVTNVVGNEVTILKIERPNRGGQPGQGGQNGQGGDQQGNNRSGNAGAPTASFGGGAGGGRFFGGGRNGQGGQISQQDRQQMIERLKQMSTGEEKFIIPVGIKMLKRDTSDTGSQGKGQAPKMVEASLSDVKSDSMLTIWLDKNAKDKKVAAFVLIMN